jgi:hypothetical protein
LSKSLLTWLIWYVAYVTNLMPKKAGYMGGAASPRQDFIGIRPDYKRDLPFAFGQYVQASTSNPDNSMKARTFSAVTLMPTGSGNGSVKVMNLNTGKVCSRMRSQITEVPIPLEWIEILNIWADVSGKMPRH